MHALPNEMVPEMKAYAHTKAWISWTSNEIVMKDVSDWTISSTKLELRSA